MTPTRHDERIELRIPSESLAEWRAAADEERMSLAEWIRRQCYQAIANRELARMLATGRIKPNDPLVEGSITPGPASARAVFTDAILMRAREERESRLEMKPSRIETPMKPSRIESYAPKDELAARRRKPKKGGK